jgi:hypothetical protein
MYSPDFWSLEDAFGDLSLRQETNSSPVIGSESDDDGGCYSVSLDTKLGAGVLTPYRSFSNSTNGLRQMHFHAQYYTE